MDLIEVNNVFVAVFEKKILDGLLGVLDTQRTKFWGTGGTVDYVKAKGFNAQSVIRGFDYGGRVKSLDRANFVRILADRKNAEHTAHLKSEGLEPIDLVVVDLYAPDPSIFPESMDIGGQSLIRSAIKNFNSVALAFDEESIEKLILELNKNALMTSLAFRRQQAKAAAKFIAGRTKLEAEMFEKVSG
ncbi:MAG: Bifunctional purine biosynthesis protein [Candidatus Curtissbacteria bacterium GW2011_GWA1_40_16]|uniref:Bifunctional purine biosynthesis protein n=1 Tax=Candidatus Curtissbacteria bacterium GW2011_GWA1_40_16 TaxID=1618405 RepID=A0A0G0RFK5_9BACT|nr:MAG: Bifunctional purine biosynthesis protein [Candidatus Curtissbacteria bacterium GW2011_GWA1_40_16]